MDSQEKSKSIKRAKSGSEVPGKAKEAFSTSNSPTSIKKPIHSEVNGLNRSNSSSKSSSPLANRSRATSLNSNDLAAGKSVFDRIPDIEKKKPAPNPSYVVPSKANVVSFESNKVKQLAETLGGVLKPGLETIISRNRSESQPSNSKSQSRPSTPSQSAVINGQVETRKSMDLSLKLDKSNADVIGKNYTELHSNDPDPVERPDVKSLVATMNKKLESPLKQKVTDEKMIMKKSTLNSRPSSPSHSMKLDSMIRNYDTDKSKFEPTQMLSVHENNDFISNNSVYFNATDNISNFSGLNVANHSRTFTESSGSQFYDALESSPLFLKVQIENSEASSTGESVRSENSIMGSMKPLQSKVKSEETLKITVNNFINDIDERIESQGQKKTFQFTSPSYIKNVKNRSTILFSNGTDDSNSTGLTNNSHSFHYYDRNEIEMCASWLNGFIDVSFDKDLSHLFPDHAVIKTDENDYEQLFDVCKDGILLALVINKIVPGAIDMKAMKIPPKNQMQMMQNAQVMLSGAKNIGAKMYNVGPTDIVEGKKSQVLSIIWQLIKIGMVSKVSIQRKPTLARLLNETEIKGDPSLITNESLITKWVNFQLQLSGSSRRLVDYGKDLSDGEIVVILLKQLISNDLPNYDQLMATANRISKMEGDERIQNALALADQMGCQKLVCTDDVRTGKRDRLIVFFAHLIDRYPNFEESISRHLSTLSSKENEITNTKMSMLSTQLNEIGKRKNMLEEELERISSVTESTKSQSQINESKLISQFQEEISKYGHKLKELEKQHEITHSLNLQLQEVNSGIQAQLSKKSSDLETLQIDYNMLQQGYDEVLSSKTELENKFHLMEQHLNDGKLTSSELLARVDQLEAKKVELADELKKMVREKQLSDQSVASLQETIANNEIEKKQLHEQLTKITSSNQQLNGKNIEIGNQLIAETEKLKSVIAQEKKKNEVLEAEKGKLLNEVKRADQRNVDRHLTANEALEKLDIAQTEVLNLKEEVRRLKKSQQTQEEATKEIENQLKISMRERDRFKVENAHIQDEKDNLTVSLHKAIAESQRDKGKITQAKNTLSEVAAKLGSLHTEKLALDEKIHKLTTENQKLSKTLHNIEGEKNANQEELNNLKVQYETLNTLVMDSKSKIDHVLRSCCDPAYGDVIMELKEVIQNNLRLDTKSAKNSPSNQRIMKPSPESSSDLRNSSAVLVKAFTTVLHSLQTEREERTLSGKQLIQYRDVELVRAKQTIDELADENRNLKQIEIPRLIEKVTQSENEFKKRDTDLTRTLNDAQNSKTQLENQLKKVTDCCRLLELSVIESQSKIEQILTSSRENSSGQTPVEILEILSGSIGVKEDSNKTDSIRRIVPRLSGPKATIESDTIEKLSIDLKNNLFTLNKAYAALFHGLQGERENNKTTKKKLDACNENLNKANAELKDLNAECKSMKKELPRLQDQLSESKNTIISLQNKLTDSEVVKSRLEDTIKKYSMISIQLEGILTDMQIKIDQSIRSTSANAPREIADFLAASLSESDKRAETLRRLASNSNSSSNDPTARTGWMFSQNFESTVQLLDSSIRSSVTTIVKAYITVLNNLKIANEKQSEMQTELIQCRDVDLVREITSKNVIAEQLKNLKDLDIPKLKERNLQLENTIRDRELDFKNKFEISLMEKKGIEENLNKVVLNNRQLETCLNDVGSKIEQIINQIRSTPENQIPKDLLSIFVDPKDRSRTNSKAVMARQDSQKLQSNVKTTIVTLAHAFSTLLQCYQFELSQHQLSDKELSRSNDLNDELYDDNRKLRQIEIPRLEDLIAEQVKKIQNRENEVLELKKEQDEWNKERMRLQEMETQLNEALTNEIPSLKSKLTESQLQLKFKDSEIANWKKTVDTVRGQPRTSLIGSLDANQSSRSKLSRVNNVPSDEGTISSKSANVLKSIKTLKLQLEQSRDKNMKLDIVRFDIQESMKNHGQIAADVDRQIEEINLILQQ